MSRITIVGGAGAIGLVHTWQLAAAGHTVTVLDAYPDGMKGTSFSNLEKASNLRFTFKEIEKLKESLPEQGENRNTFLNKLSSLPTNIAEKINQFLPEGKEHFTLNEIHGFIQNTLEIPINKIRLAQTSKEITEPQDLIITTTKNDALNSKLAKKINQIPKHPETPVVVFANGIMPWIFPEEDFGGTRLESLKSIRQFADIIGHQKLKGGVLIKYGAEVLEPGLIRSGIPKETRNIIGNSNNTNITSDLVAIKDIYDKSALPLEIGNVKNAIISKLGFNYVNSMFPTIFGRTDFNLEDPNLQRAMRTVAKEYYSFAAELGVSLAPTKETYADRAIEAAKITAGLSPSALQDVRKGKTTEKDQYMKAVIEIAEAKFIKIPNIKAMYNLLSKVEEKAQSDLQNLQDYQDKLYNLLTKNRGDLGKTSEAAGHHHRPIF